MTVQENPIRKHMVATYFAARWGVAAMGLLLPPLLWIGGNVLGHEPLQQSISRYYYTVMRDQLVGVLVAVAVLLVVYRGYSAFENWALNLAGLFLACVAFFPTAEKKVRGEWFTLHGAFAVLFFACIAYVCLLRARDTLGLVEDEDLRERLGKAYVWLGILMAASPLVAAVLAVAFRAEAEGSPFVFFAEATGVVVFSLYWIVKGIEIAKTDSERLAMEGKLQVRSYRLKDLFAPLPVTRALEPPAPGASAPSPASVPG